MKRLYTSLLLITAVLFGTAKAHAAIVIVAGSPTAYYAPHYASYYGGYYGYRRPWVRSYRVVRVPQRVYYAPTPYYYAPAPAPVVIAPVLPLALSIGLHIR